MLVVNVGYFKRGISIWTATTVSHNVTKRNKQCQEANGSILSGLQHVICITTIEGKIWRMHKYHWVYIVNLIIKYTTLARFNTKTYMLRVFLSNSSLVVVAKMSKVYQYNNYYIVAIKRLHTTCTQSDTFKNTLTLYLYPP